MSSFSRCFFARSVAVIRSSLRSWARATAPVSSFMRKFIPRMLSAADGRGAAGGEVALIVQGEGQLAQAGSSVTKMPPSPAVIVL